MEKQVGCIYPFEGEWCLFNINVVSQQDQIWVKGNTVSSLIIKGRFCFSLLFTQHILMFDLHVFCRVRQWNEMKKCVANFTGKLLHNDFDRGFSTPNACLWADAVVKILFNIVWWCNAYAPCKSCFPRYRLFLKHSKVQKKEHAI